MSHGRVESRRSKIFGGVSNTIIVSEQFEARHKLSNSILDWYEQFRRSSCYCLFWKKLSHVLEETTWKYKG